MFVLFISYCITGYFPVVQIFPISKLTDLADIFLIQKFMITQLKISSEILLHVLTQDECHQHRILHLWSPYVREHLDAGNS